MVYSSSLMEANFFTIAQRREYMLKAVEEANRLQTIQQLSNVRKGRESPHSSCFGVMEGETLRRIHLCDCLSALLAVHTAKGMATIR